MATWTAWVAPKTLRPADAARQVGMSEAQLRDVNHIPSHMLVKAGSTLLVPRNAQRQADVSEHLAENAMMALTPEQAAQRRLALKAGKRDSVASVAKRYRVSNTQVAQWNQVGTGASFKPGQTIVVYVAAHTPARAKAVRVAARKGSGRASGGAGTARVALKPVKATARSATRE
jgi:membrane-bound lytic murein transglycosylase D